MKEKKIVAIICILTSFFIAVISLDCGIITVGKQTGNADYVLLIDPGHGGMDGGASGSDGTLEKDINLSIAKLLANEAEQYSCRVILTREQDEWLCNTDEGSIRSRKTADLKARCEMIKQYAPDLTISIHLNSFKEDPSVRGAQVFYPAGSSQADSSDVMHQCRQLAELLQARLNETLQQDNPRTAMTRDGVFIFKEVERPVIIVECGFLSNPSECDTLKSDEYQQNLARCIMGAIAEFAELEKPETVEIIDSLDDLTT